MKTWKPKFRRGLALFLVLVMCLSTLQLTAFAASERTGESSYHTPEHEHNSEGWICTPYCSIPEHVHTAECYVEPTPEEEEAAKTPVTLPDDLPIEGDSETGTDDFGNEYEPPEFVVGPAGDGEDAIPGGDDPAELPDDGDEPTIQPDGGEDEPSGLPAEDDDAPAAQPGEEPGSEGEDGGEDVTPDESADSSDPAAPDGEDGDSEAGDGSEDAAPDGSGDSSDASSDSGEPAAQDDNSGSEELTDTDPPLNEEPITYCGLEEHIHTAACAEKEDGGWHCVPNTNITINIPKDRVAIGTFDLLSGVTTSPAYCGNWPVSLRVVSVTRADGSDVAVKSEHLLEAEEGVFYRVEYAAYVDSDDPEIPLGDLAYGTSIVEGVTVEGAARIGDVGYATLQEAITAAGNSQEEIYLLTDVYENITSSNSYRLDLQGYTVHSGVVGKNVFTITGGTVVIENGGITGGDWGDKTNQNGKGVMATNADVTLRNCEIKDNKGYFTGGGVYSSNGTLTLEACTVSGNTSSTNGAGVYATNSTVTIINGTKLLNNVSGSGGGGGGVYTINSTLSMNNVVVNGNIAGNGNGSGIYTWTTTADIQNVVFTENGSGKSSSSIYIYYGMDTSLKNVEIEQEDVLPTSYYALYASMTKGNLTMEDCSIHNSYGSVYLAGTGSKTLTNCQFTDNICTATSFGAPLYTYAGSAEITGCTFTGNTGYYAGAIRNAASSGTTTLNDCLISGNTANYSAGGIYTSAGTVVVNDTVIKENQTLGTNSNVSGGVVATSSSATFTMNSGALYDNRVMAGSSLANDIYASTKTSVLKASDMVDGDVDFSDYAWSNLSSTILTDALNLRSGSWTAVIGGAVAQIGDTTYDTLIDALNAVQDGETIRLLGTYAALTKSFTVTKSFTLDLADAVKVYPSSTSYAFTVTTGSLTLKGNSGGMMTTKITFSGTGTVNIDGDVTLKPLSTGGASNALIQCTGGGTLNINGSPSYVSARVTKGTVTVGEEAQADTLELYLSPTSTSLTNLTGLTVNGAVDTMILTATGKTAMVILNAPIENLTLKFGALSATYPSILAKENFYAEALSVYPLLQNTSSYDKDTGYVNSNGYISAYALANPTMPVKDFTVISGGAGKVNLDKAEWYNPLVSSGTLLTWSTSDGGDGKDYKFLTSVAEDADGNVVLHKIVVNGNYVLIDSTNGNNSNDGLSLAKPVKTFERAKTVMEENNLSTIHVLGAISVTGTETWSLENGQRVESFPTYKGALVQVASGAALTLENVTIDGLGIQRTTPLIVNSGTLNIENGTTLTGGFNTDHLYAEDHNHYDGGAVWNGGTLNMSGGVIENNTARNGGGVFSKGTFNLSGGEIRSNSGYGDAVNYSTSAKVNLKSVNAGGGVFLGLSGSKMEMSGGTISGNTAAMGGGISLGNKTNVFTAYGGPKFFMTGGTIDGNTSLSEGGGLFIQEQCEGTITGGEITNNQSLGGAFGGGGIYVNGGVTASSINGKLTLENVAIVNNSAGSDGGGVAGCPTSNLNIYLSDGGVIAGNTAGGQPYDVFIQRLVADPYHTGHRGTAYISKYMLGGGLYNWMDRKTGERMPSQSFHSVNVFLYGTPNASDVEYAQSLSKVLISGNYAANAGGGLGTNGDITIGKDSTETVTFDVTFHKSWINYDGSQMTEDELNAVQDKLESIGFVLWRRPASTGGNTNGGTSVSYPDGTVLLSDRAVPLTDAPAEDTGLILGNPPEGDGWSAVDWLFRGWNGSSLNSGSFWGELTFTDLLPGYEYAISEISSSTYAPQETYVYFDESNYRVLNNSDNPAFINELLPAKLILEKKVKDDDGVLNDQELADLEFTFKITLITTDGKLTEETVQLKAGEQYEIDKLVPGTRYSIQELLPDGSRWYVTSEGTVDKNVSTGETVKGDVTISNTLEVGNNTVTFTNSTTPYGSLTVQKTVVGGTSADKSRGWSFEIQLYTEENGVKSALSPTSIPKIDFGGVTPENSENNDYTKVAVTLKDGEAYTINYLPLGVFYEVTEVQGTDFPQNCTVTYTEASGQIVKHNDSFTAAFTNTLPVPQTVSVTVNKVWDDGDSASRPDHILVRLLRDGQPYGESVVLNDANGWSHTWSGLAKNHEDDQNTAYVWTVEEVDVPEGYTVATEHSGEVWTITNTKPVTPPPPEDEEEPDPEPEPDPGPGPGPGPDPERPNRPTNPQLPDPNDPDSPEEITVLEEDVPTTYIKVWDPEEEEFIYVPEDEVPLVSLDPVPQTGDPSSTGLLAAVCLTSAVGLGVVYQAKPRKKEDAE